MWFIGAYKSKNMKTDSFEYLYPWLTKTEGTPPPHNKKKQKTNPHFNIF